MLLTVVTVNYFFSVTISYTKILLKLFVFMVCLIVELLKLLH